MRFHFGPIPDEFTPDATWRPIREPGPWMFQLLAHPVGIGVAVLIGYCWSRLGLPPLTIKQGEAAAFLIALALSFPALIVVHELIHAAIHPAFGRSSATVIGAWPRRLLFYAHYSGPLSRNRFLAIFAAPFLIITLLPLLVAMTGVLPPMMRLAAAWFSTWNALFACGDIIGFALIAAQIPRDALVQNKGWQTYWKPSPASADL